jgi:hypothetical protein
MQIPKLVSLSLLSKTQFQALLNLKLICQAQLKQKQLTKVQCEMYSSQAITIQQEVSKVLEVKAILEVFIRI